MDGAPGCVGDVQTTTLSPQMREEEAEMEAEMEADDAFLQMKLLLPKNFSMTLNVEVEFGASGAKTGVKYLERPHRSQTHLIN